ncbi:MAG: hypothetical protein V3U08_01915 [Nitrospirales bacterium]
MARQSHKWRVEDRSLPIGERYNYEKGSSGERDGVRRDAYLQSRGLEQAHGWNEGASEEKAVLSARCAVNQAIQASAAKVSGNVIRAELRMNKGNATSVVLTSLSRLSRGYSYDV